MLNKFQEHIDLNFSFLRDKKLLIAVSGGIDSVVLTHLLHRLRFKLVLAHCNFCLRGEESNKDEKFVINLAKSLAVKVFTKRFNTNEHAKKEKLSVQMAARNLRYAWFKELIELQELDYILTAHHLDDELETVLINFTRGTGLEGLTGIPEKNKNVIRPLLSFCRSDVERFAKDNNLTWREDKSNSEKKYHRNKIRHEVIPILKQINPNLLFSFKKTQEYLGQSQIIIKDKVQEVVEEVCTKDGGLLKVDIQKIKKFSNPKAYLYQILKEYNFTEWNDVESLITAQSGKQVFSESHRLIKDRDHFLIKPILTKDKSNNFKIEKDQKLLTTETFSMYFNKTKNELLGCKNENIVLVDGDLLKFPLIVRRWQEGDYFYPFGMRGKKKLSKFFKDEKLSLFDKENIWILSSNNNIVWIVGRRLDNRFKITKNTKNIVQIEYIIQ